MPPCLPFLVFSLSLGLLMDYYIPRCRRCRARPGPVLIVVIVVVLVVMIAFLLLVFVIADCVFILDYTAYTLYT
jgi:hypothetical protein